MSREWEASRNTAQRAFLALARLETALGLVDHIDPALAADEAVVAMAAAQGLQRVTDFHGFKP